MHVIYRFSHMKGPMVAFIVCNLIVLFAIFGPMVSKYPISYADPYYSYTLPKSKTLSKYGIMTGNRREKHITQDRFDYYNAIPDAIVKVNGKKQVKKNNRTERSYDVTLDSYHTIGFVYKNLTKEEFDAVCNYAEETGKQMLYPMINKKNIVAKIYEEDANLWYVCNQRGGAVYDKTGEYQENYLKDSNGDYQYFIKKMNGAQYQVRVLYYDWYQYENGQEPCFWFGTDKFGKDIFIELAVGIRFSLILAYATSILNCLIGFSLGVIEGYYGGKVDLVMQHIENIFVGIPFVVIVLVFQLLFVKRIGIIPSILFIFCFERWGEISATVRTQVYRYKMQDYIISARALGASDMRIILKHILPNSIGTIITRLTFMIPGLMRSETILSYLGVIDFSKYNLCSIGTVFNNIRGVISVTPYINLIPQIFMCILMLCYNVIGNGLRDAINPSADAR